MNRFKELLPRILGSKKAIYAYIPIGINAVATLFGVDIATSKMVLTVDLFFGALLAAQFLLDLRWGSQSDGSGNGSSGG